MKSIKQHSRFISLLIVVEIIVLLIFYLFQAFFGPLINTELIADSVSILGIGGLILAYVNYALQKKKDKQEALEKEAEADRLCTEAKRHVVTSLISQLEVIKVWTKGPKGNGYNPEYQQEWIKTSIRTVGNPFNSVYEISYSSLKNINLLPGLIELGEPINLALAELNQEITSFNFYLDEIRQFKWSNPAKANISIHLKLNGAVNAPLTEQEDLFVKKLTEYYAHLHFTNIGYKESDRLYAKLNKLLKLLIEEKKRLE